MSKPADLSELIQADIDGVATEAELVRLRELLAADAVAREEHDRLRRLRTLLASIPPEAPPARLTADVMRRVRAEGSGAGGGIVRRLFGFRPVGRTAFPYAYAAAAGAAVGILGYHVLTGGGPLAPEAVEREAVATIGAAPDGVETGRLALTAGTIGGSATLRTLTGSVALDVELPAGGDVSVGYDPASVKFIGIANRTGGVDHVSIADGTVRWSQAQPQRVTVFLAPRSRAASRLEVRFVAGDGIAGTGTLELPGRP